MCSTTVDGRSSDVQLLCNLFLSEETGARRSDLGSPLWSLPESAAGAEGPSDAPGTWTGGAPVGPEFPRGAGERDVEAKGSGQFSDAMAG
jgi:hypothetical protein